MPQLRYTMTMSDGTGSGYFTVQWWQSAEDMSIAQAIADLSTATPISVTATTYEGGIVAGGAVGPGTPVQLVAIAQFGTTDTTVAKIVIPGCRPDAFMADGETLNPLNAWVANLTANVLNEGLTATSQPLTAYISGSRRLLRRPPIEH